MYNLGGLLVAHEESMNNNLKISLSTIDARSFLCVFKMYNDKLEIKSA